MGRKLSRIDADYGKERRGPLPERRHHLRGPDMGERDPEGRQEDGDRAENRGYEERQRKRRMLVFAVRGMVGHENLQCTDPRGRERQAPLLQAAGPYRERAGEVEARIRMQAQWAVHLLTNISASVCTRFPASAEIAAERADIGRNSSEKSASVVRPPTSLLVKAG